MASEIGGKPKTHDVLNVKRERVSCANSKTCQRKMGLSFGFIKVGATSEFQGVRRGILSTERLEKISMINKKV